MTVTFLLNAMGAKNLIYVSKGRQRMIYIIGYILLFALVLVWNHGAHKNDEADDDALRFMVRMSGYSDHKKKWWRR